MDCDLVIIGAGIHGAAIANQASARGYRVVILEQYAEAALGTSSKSSKLIHGGLRYLESGQIKLVRECLSERTRLLDEQPDLVTLKPFFIPVYRHTRRGAWLIAIGLGLYTLLGGKGFKRLAEKDWQHLDGLRRDGLTSVFRYWDAQTDDKQLTGRLINEARNQGAEVLFNADFESASCSAERCEIHFRQGARPHTLVAGALVNAGGPWVNRVLARISPACTPLDIELVQGTHIIVPGKLEQGIYYLESPLDRRAVFVMPWHDNIMIGTTETPYRGDPAEVHPLECEITYLLETWNHYFEASLQRSDIIDSFAGLRVLPAGEISAFDRSRDTLLHQAVDNPRLLSIYGGKLTSHRHTAETVMKWLKKLGTPLPRS